MTTDPTVPETRTQRLDRWGKIYGARRPGETDDEMESRIHGSARALNARLEANWPPNPPNPLAADLWLEELAALLRFHKERERNAQQEGFYGSANLHAARADEIRRRMNDARA